MTIRAAEIADIPAMHRVRLAVTENALSSPTRISHDDYQSMLLRDGRGWVFEQGGAIVGFAVGDRARRNIWALFVAPGFERRGIGRALHDVMMRWMFDVGAETVWLGTAAGTRAERFYVTAGWERVGHLENGEVRFEMSRERYADRR